MIRLDKFLCQQGIGTRSQVKQFIKKGMIRKEMTILSDPSQKIDEHSDTIYFNDKEIIFSKYHYYMLNKPHNYISATKDHSQKTVMELLIGIPYPDLFPVGRLDIDTEGLLLITDNGNLAHNLLSPKKHVDKTYYVEIKDNITNEMISRLSSGVDIGETHVTLPAKAVMLSAHTMHLTIQEGKFHQVKRMIEAVGSSVTYLKRISMGPLILDPCLELGQFRALTNQELDSLNDYL
ncbi:MAG: pseudouridine synthase [Lachnospiraceae bacterium]